MGGHAGWRPEDTAASLPGVSLASSSCHDQADVLSGLCGGGQVDHTPGWASRIPQNKRVEGDRGSEEVMC